MAQQREYHDIIFQKHQRKKHVAWITINRPQSLNAVTAETLKEIAVALDDCTTDNSIGAVVLTGVGDMAFSSGGDVRWEQEAFGKLPEDAGGGLGANVHNALHHCGKPVIARVNGYAIGYGNHIAYYCDLTIAAEHAIFGQNGPRVGSPADGMMVSQAAKILGHKRAREMWYLCRRYTAQQMLDWGLVNEVTPSLVDEKGQYFTDPARRAEALKNWRAAKKDLRALDEAVDRMCDEVLEKSPTCLRILKASFEREMDHIRDGFGDIRRQVAPHYFSTEEPVEGQRAFLEKRQVDFSRFRQ